MSQKKHLPAAGCGHHHHGSSTGSIALAFWLNLAFACVEVIGGILTNSVAILSDAVHDFGDCLSLGLSWYLERFAERGANGTYTYGFRRFSLLGSLINATVLICGSILVLTESIPRLLYPEQTEAAGMIGLALLGIAVNGFAALRLSSGKSENVKTLSWHLIEDVLGWSAILIGSIIIHFTDYYRIDAVLSVAITCFILWNVFRRLNATATLFLQGAPSDVEVETLIQELIAIEGVDSQHHTHAWSLDGAHHVLSTHVSVQAGTSVADARLIKAAIRAIAQKHGFVHVTVEVEFDQSDCSTPRF